MTTPSERDWDAEFADITSRLGDGLGQERPHDAVRSVVEPSRTPDELGQERSDTGSPEGDGTAVPGFMSQWRIPDPSPDVESPPVELTWGEDDFVPPPPAPIDTSDPALVIMIAALVLGPLWLLYLLFFDREAAALWWGAAGGLTVLGFGLAVARQPRSRDEDDLDDDGARV